MPGDLQKKLKNLKNKSNPKLSKAVQKEFDQTNAIAALGIKQTNMFNKVQIFEGDSCKEYQHPVVYGSSSSNVWAVKGSFRTIPASQTQSDQNQRKMMESFIKIFEQHKQGQKDTVPAAGEGAVEGAGTAGGDAAKDEE